MASKILNMNTIAHESFLLIRDFTNLGGGGGGKPESLTS